MLRLPSTKLLIIFSLFLMLATSTKSKLDMKQIWDAIKYDELDFLNLTMIPDDYPPGYPYEEEKNDPEIERINNASKVNTLNQFHTKKIIKILKEIKETNRIVEEELYLVTEIETHNCESIFKRFNQKCKELIDRLSNETRLQNAKYTLEFRTKSLEKMLEHVREVENNDDYICSIQPQWMICLLRNAQDVGEAEELLIDARDAEKLHIIVENRAKYLKCQRDSFWKTITFQC